MPTLYRLHLSKPVQGFGKPSVAAELAPVTGTHCPELGMAVRPLGSAIREALPHYYRKAYDLNSGPHWIEFGEKAGCYITLRNAKGKYLNTVYATPYQFDGASA